MRRHTIIIFILLAFASMLILYFSQTKQLNNGFERKIVEYKIQTAKILPLPSKWMYFSGTYDSKIFLRDIQQLGSLYATDPQLKKLTPVNVTLSLDSGIQKQDLTLGVSNNNIFVTNFRSSKIDLISTVDGKKKTHFIPALNFDQPVLVSGKYIFGREVWRKGNDLHRNIGKYDYLKNKTIKTHRPSEQGDGYFSTDGILKADLKNSKLFYLYYYRGAFLCLDTGLNLLYEAKTIDTVRSSNVKPTMLNISKENKENITLTQAAPPNIVNRDYTTDGTFLYILSGLRADNQRFSDFRNSQIIDVYRIKDGTYKNSFQIPNYKNNKLREIRFDRGFMYANFGEYLIKFSFHP